MYSWSAVCTMWTTWFGCLCFVPLVRCVHHVELFEESYGEDAKRLSLESCLSCNWIGDLMAYDIPLA